MLLRRRPSDLPLARDPSSRFLVWLTALMTCLATLALAGAMMVSEVAQRWDSGLAGGLTVQVSPLPGDPAAALLAERVDAALAVLRGTSGIAAARALTTAEASHLLEPWLGPDAANDPLLPVPALIDVAVGGRVDVEALGARLAAAAPGVTVDDHAAWLSDLRAFAGAVEMAAFGVMAVVGGAGVLAVVFAVRAGLAIHRNVVQLLHLMGASDRYVARQFEAHVLALALRGGFGGLALAALTLAGLGHAAGGLTASLLPDLELTPWQWAALLVVPATASILAVATARWTVLRTLESMP